MDKEFGLMLINGASGGLGSKLVEYFLEQGYRNLACHYNTSEDSIAELLDRYDMDPKKHLYQADLSKEEDVQNMAKSIEKTLGTVDLLLNMMGGSTNGVSWKLTLEEYQKVIAINLTSTFLACREFIPAMRAKKYGRIINVSSVVGFTGVVGASHYCAAKAAVVGFSKALSLELASRNITVNTLALGYFNAGIIDQVSEKLQATIKARIPTKSFGEVRELGGLIKYLMSKDAQYITGQVHHINGGMY